MLAEFSGNQHLTLGGKKMTAAVSRYLPGRKFPLYYVDPRLFYLIMLWSLFVNDCCFSFSVSTRTAMAKLRHGCKRWHATHSEINGTKYFYYKLKPTLNLPLLNFFDY